MRLLNINSYTFLEFHGENIPPYIIASHRWCDDETTFKDVLKKRNKESKGWQKIEGFCERARRDNELLKSFENATCCEWLWIDTACIDQRSSAEVSESINSMHVWYGAAQECHAYMADVKPFPASQQLAEVLDDFKNSEWFKRGWTLQELLAPRCVIFFTRTWQIIGHKCSDCSTSQSCEGAGPLLNAIIAEVTGVPEEVLRDYERSRSVSVEEKMKWQAGRRTTRIEDRAYCLLGLFDVHMPLLYGEGEKAMLRLERTIFEELERPWRSQLQLHFDDYNEGLGSRVSPPTKRYLRSSRPLAIMRHSNVEGEVSCICGYCDDDGYLIACDICQYWQHALCYFPETESVGMSKVREHGCVKCRPRDLDAKAAVSRQKEKRARKLNAFRQAARAKMVSLKRNAHDVPDDSATGATATKRQHNDVEEYRREDHADFQDVAEDSTRLPTAAFDEKSEDDRKYAGTDAPSFAEVAVEDLVDSEFDQALSRPALPDGTESDVRDIEVGMWSSAPWPLAQFGDDRLAQYTTATHDNSFAFGPAVWDFIPPNQNAQYPADLSFGGHDTSTSAIFSNDAISGSASQELTWHAEGHSLTSPPGMLLGRSDPTWSTTDPTSSTGLSLEPTPSAFTSAFGAGEEVYITGWEQFNSSLNFEASAPSFSSGLQTQLQQTSAPAPAAHRPSRQQLRAEDDSDIVEFGNRTHGISAGNEASSGISTAGSSGPQDKAAYHGNHALADYQRQLMLLDDQRREGTGVAHPSATRSESSIFPRRSQTHVRRLQTERPEKCPIPTCDYHTKGFAREYDQQRHILTHYHGQMTCPFCASVDTQAEKTFNRADVFKRHLASVHGVDQKPLAARKKPPESESVAANGQPGSGQCSVCARVFANAQAFFDHLDDCIVRTVRRQELPVTFTCEHAECASAGVGFRYSKDLQRHYRTRHGDGELKLLHCPIEGCKATFTRKDHLIRHQRLVHGVEVNRRPQQNAQVAASV